MESEALDLDPFSDPFSTCYSIHSLSSTKPFFDLKETQTQEPVETFDFQFHSQVTPNPTMYTYIFVLRFYNNLHEIWKNYCYEIVVTRTQLIDQQRHTQTLVSVARNRISHKIKCKGTFELLNNVNTRYYYTLYIRRYRDTCTKEIIKKGDNIGAMLWNTGAYSDISLIVGDKILRVHREVLSQKSEVFKKMFAHQMAESQNGIVKIDDLNAEVVEEMLSYIYIGRSGNIAKMPRELFEASHKYALHELQSLCEEQLIFSLNQQNVIDILELANLYDLMDLRENIMSFVRKYEADMVEEPSFRSFLCRALKINSAVETLLLADRYRMDDVKKETLKFIKEHDKEMMETAEFLELFKTHPDLTREVFEFIYAKAVESPAEPNTTEESNI